MYTYIYIYIYVHTHIGVLSIDEIRNGFAKMFGEDSDEVKNALEVFENLDIDGSHFIDYTEFCAAGLGQKLRAPYLRQNVFERIIIPIFGSTLSGGR